MSDRCTPIVSHIRRLQGQMSALSAAMEDGKSCKDIAHLVRSVCASCDAVRVRIATAYIQDALDEAKDLSEDEWKALESLLMR